MSQELSKDQVKLFDREVKMVFQHKVADIRNRVRVKTGNAASVQFGVVGKTSTVLKTGFGSDNPGGNMSHAPVTITTQNWTTLAEYTDIFLNKQVDFDERQIIAESVGLAMQRRLTQLVIDALVASSPSKTVADNVSGSSDNLNTSMLRRAAMLLAKDGAFDIGNVTLLAHSYGVHYLPKEVVVSSIDYNNKKAMVNGDSGDIYGYNILQVGDMSEGGLPLSTNARSNFAFNKAAVGLFVNMEPWVDISWDHRRGMHAITGYLSANAGVIDPLGVVKITTDESHLA